MKSPGIESYHDERGRLAALVLRRDYRPNGIEFPTPDEVTQQLGAMVRPAGYRVDPHEHTPQERRIHDTVEVLIVRSGLIEVTLYDPERKPYESFRVGPLEAVLLAAGGHGVLFIEESDVLEVKQGPYAEVADKIRFSPTA